MSYQTILTVIGQLPCSRVSRLNGIEADCGATPSVYWKYGAYRKHKRGPTSGLRKEEEPVLDGATRPSGQ